MWQTDHVCVTNHVADPVQVTANQYKVVLSDDLYHLLEHLCPEGCDLSQDSYAPVHRAREVTDEYEN